MAEFELKKIKNIIFDLGGVLLEIDFKKSTDAFTLLGLSDINGFSGIFAKHPLFLDYETGKIDDTEFIENIRKQTGLMANDHDIAAAWNKLIVGFTDEKTQFLFKIRQHYNIYLLSNTNALHARLYEKMFYGSTGVSFHSMFKGVYYSHLTGYRKPDKKAYIQVLEENKLKAEETLFVDDLEINTKAASNMGIQVLLYKNNASFFDIFNLGNNNF